MTLLSVRQESQLNLRCSGTLYTRPRQRELQSNEMLVPTGMLLKEGAGKGRSDSKRQRNEQEEKHSKVTEACWLPRQQGGKEWK